MYKRSTLYDSRNVVFFVLTTWGGDRLNSYVLQTKKKQKKLASGGDEVTTARVRRSKVAGRWVQRYGHALTCFNLSFFLNTSWGNLPAIAKVTLAWGENSVWAGSYILYRRGFYLAELKAKETSMHHTKRCLVLEITCCLCWITHLDIASRRSTKC